MLCLHVTVTLLQVYLGAMGDAHIYASLAIQLNSMVSGDLLFDQLQEHLFVMTQSMVRAIKSLPQKSWKHLRSRQATDGSRGGRETACIAKPVLGSSCVPVWLTGLGTGLLQKLEEAWEKSCYPKLWPVYVYVSLSQTVSAVMEECELQVIKGCSIGMKTSKRLQIPGFLCVEQELFGQQFASLSEQKNASLQGSQVMWSVLVLQKIKKKREVLCN